jgi:hypothetical protein
VWMEYDNFILAIIPNDIVTALGGGVAIYYH